MPNMEPTPSAQSVMRDQPAPSPAQIDMKQPLPQDPTKPAPDAQQQPGEYAAIKLTDTQKRAMAKVVAAATPKIAADEVSGNQNLIAARDMLVKLGLMTFAPGNATLTDQGNKVMKDYALVDDAGQLTDDGETFAHTNEEGQPEEKPTTPTPTSPLGELPPVGAPVSGVTDGAETRLPPMEDEDEEKFVMLKYLLELKK